MYLSCAAGVAYEYDMPDIVKRHLRLMTELDSQGVGVESPS